MLNHSGYRRNAASKSEQLLLKDIILRAVHILTSSASDDLQTAVGALEEMKAQIEDYEANHEDNLRRRLERQGI